MRKINTQDVFKFARILKAAEINDALVDLVTEGKKKNADVEAIGIKAFFSIASACGNPKLEGEFYDLFGGIVGKSPEEVKEQDLDVTISEIGQIAKENDLKSFFSSASRLTK